MGVIPSNFFHKSTVLLALQHEADIMQSWQPEIVLPQLVFFYELI